MSALMSASGGWDEEKISRHFDFEEARLIISLPLSSLRSD